MTVFMKNYFSDTFHKFGLHNLILIVLWSNIAVLGTISSKCSYISNLQHTRPGKEHPSCPPPPPPPSSCDPLKPRSATDLFGRTPTSQTSVSIIDVNRHEWADRGGRGGGGGERGGGKMKVRCNGDKWPRGDCSYVKLSSSRKVVIYGVSCLTQ